MPDYFIGVDGGGTNCRIRLADENLHTLAETRSGRSNLQLDGGHPAYRSIMDALPQLFADAGLTDAAAATTYGCFGMAGARLKSARDSFAERDWPLAGVEVLDDIDIARAGAHGGEDGAVIIIGTGSAGLHIAGRERHQVGGWGFHVGDTTSGAILGRALARRTVEATDGLKSGSALTAAILAHLGGSLDAVMDWSFRAKPADFGELVPLFFSYYEQGDPVARELMADELRQVDAFVDWFRARGASRMAVVGGLGTRLFPLLVERYGDFVMLPRHDPLHGALILARQTFGHH